MARRRRRSLRRRIFRNRYNPGSNWITLGDIVSNIRETYYCWTHRIPPGARLHWRDGRIVGHETDRRW